MIIVGKAKDDRAPWKESDRLLEYPKRKLGVQDDY